MTLAVYTAFDASEVVAIRIGNWSQLCSPYTADAVIRQVPARAGVYVLWANPHGAGWECLVIGRAENLKKRLLEHLAGEDPRVVKTGGPRCGFCWIEIADEIERAGVEKYLGHVLARDPKAAGGDPGAEPLRVPLPPRPPSATPYPYV